MSGAVDLTKDRRVLMANQYTNDYAADSFKVRADYLPLVKHVLIPQYEILEREKEIFAQIENDYHGEQPLFIPILKGAVRFSVDMFRFARKLDPEFEFMSASSYGARLESGEVRLELREVSRLLEKLKNRRRHVILVEDIVDTGNTLSHIVEVLRNLDEIIDAQPEFKEFQRKGSYTPVSVSICTLLDKPSRRKDKNADLPISYVGFIIPDVWVFGYGLDVWNDRGRTLDHICVLNSSYLDESRLEDFFKKLEGR